MWLLSTTKTSFLLTFMIWNIFTEAVTFLLCWPSSDRASLLSQASTSLRTFVCAVPPARIALLTDILMVGFLTSFSSFFKYHCLCDAFHDCLYKILPIPQPSLSHLSCVADCYNNESWFFVSQPLCWRSLLLPSPRNALYLPILLNLCWASWLAWNRIWQKCKF